MIQSNHLILCHPLVLLPSVSNRIFSNELAFHIRWPKYWSFSFSISPSNEYSGLISFWINWFDLLAVQRTLKSPLQHHSLKASVLQHPVFFMVQLSHLYVTTEKTIALTRWTFVSKVISLLFNTVPMFVIAFLPRNKCFNFMAAVTIHSDLFLLASLYFLPQLTLTQSWMCHRWHTLVLTVVQWLPRCLMRGCQQFFSSPSQFSTAYPPSLHVGGTLSSVPQAAPASLLSLHAWLFTSLCGFHILTPASAYLPAL